MRLLAVAISARMIAELAAADGWEVIACDRFGDCDLRAVAASVTGPGNDELAALAAEIEADACVYGAGLENRPDLVGRLAHGRELLGVSPERLIALRDPWAVADAVWAAGARAPETRRIGDTGPPGVSGASAAEVGRGEWLCKPLRSGGGRDVRRWAGGRLRATEILQRRIRGMSCSAVAIGDGARAAVLGLTEQLHRPRGFGWVGNLTPPRLPAAQRAELHRQLGAVCDEVAARFETRGAFGVDAIWDGRHAWVLEVNPRPPASLELFDSGTFAAHVSGARGRGLPPLVTPASRCARVKLVLFADRDLRAPSPDWWPAGLVHDIPRAGEVIGRGQPVCTLIASTDDVAELTERGARLLAGLPSAVLARG